MRAVRLNYHYVIKLLSKNSNNSAGTTRTKKQTCCRDQKSNKTVQIVIQESNDEIITNLSDITAGKKTFMLTICNLQ